METKQLMKNVIHSRCQKAETDDKVEKSQRAPRIAVLAFVILCFQKIYQAVVFPISVGAEDLYCREHSYYKSKFSMALFQMLCESAAITCPLRKLRFS